MSIYTELVEYVDTTRTEAFTARAQAWQARLIPWIDLHDDFPESALRECFRRRAVDDYEAERGRRIEHFYKRDAIQVVVGSFDESFKRHQGLPAHARSFFGEAAHGGRHSHFTTLQTRHRVLAHAHRFGHFRL